MRASIRRTLPSLLKCVIMVTGVPHMELRSKFLIHLHPTTCMSFWVQHHLSPFQYENGLILLSRPLDYGRASIHTITIQASDGTFTTTEPASVTVSVLNVSDNPPTIVPSRAPLQVFKSIVPEYPIYSLLTEDADVSLAPAPSKLWTHLRSCHFLSARMGCSTLSGL